MDRNGLEPYANQVGGHNTILKPRGSARIYKPLCDNELAFYQKLRMDDQSALAELAEFTPQFHGTGSIAFIEDDQQPSSRQVSHYLILEDLLHGYRKPCMLDVKLGRIQQSVGASPEKRRRQIEKSLRTTSNALGFRLCGSQCYNVKTGALTYKDKYWGRKVSADKILPVLRDWFSDGVSIDLLLVQFVLRKLTRLTQVVADLRHYRFWSSSVLWYYDGSPRDPQTRLQTAGVKLVDFGNVTYLEENPSVDHDTVLGLSNLSIHLARLLTLEAQASQPPRSLNRYRYKKPDRCSYKIRRLRGRRRTSASRSVSPTREPPTMLVEDEGKGTISSPMLARQRSRSTTA